MIDLIQENSPFINITKDRVHFPTGLLIEKWMLYYYPILEGSTNIPQINGEINLAFEIQFKNIIAAYSSMGGFSAFYNDLMNKGIPKEQQADFITLAKKIKGTITVMPMKYIGRSISNNYYSIFQFKPAKTRVNSSSIDIEYLIKASGTFSIPFEYFEAFKIIGSFVSGQDSILFKWAEFSVNASRQNLTIEKVLSEVLKSPITKREIAELKKIYTTILKKEGCVFCVWTGKKISKYDVDHLIPFSVWKNNDLWNLLPSESETNNQKRDKIPSAEFIDSRKDFIIHYWKLINENQSHRFQKEIRVALIGNNTIDNWENAAINQLKMSCNYLVANRGYQSWKI